MKKWVTWCLGVFMAAFVVFFLIQIGATIYSNQNSFKHFRFEKLREQGYYPSAEDYPNTVWQCVDQKMSFRIFSDGEDWMTGEFSDGTGNYRFVAIISGYNADIVFTAYDSPQTTDSPHYDADGVYFLHCEPYVLGTLYAEYVFKDGKFVCTVNGGNLANYRSGDILVFEPMGKIVKDPVARYSCKEIDLWLEEFRGIEGYYSGEIMLDRKSVPIQALEIGNNDYYLISMQNGITNNLREGTSSRLAHWFIENDGTTLKVRISDGHLEEPLAYPEWDYEMAALTFTQVPM